MQNDDIKRLSRLTAILTILQTKKLVTATELSGKFSVSARTIYRDIRALEQAGIPVLTEEGKGYTLMDGYKIPPVMFTESEANALITAEHLILNNKDASFVNEYSKAIGKIKSILRNTTKDKANLLSNRLAIWSDSSISQTSNHLSILQSALTNFNLVRLRYYSPENNETTERQVEPFAIYSTQGNWLLIAYCRLRNDFRSFRLDRIKEMSVLPQTFEPHTITLENYFDMCRKKYQNP